MSNQVTRPEQQSGGQRPAWPGFTDADRDAAIAAQRSVWLRKQITGICGMSAYRTARIFLDLHRGFDARGMTKDQIADEFGGGHLSHIKREDFLAAVEAWREGAK